MARQRTFDEDEAVAAAVRVFTAHGYEGTSVDDLVAALGVHRGSLYRTFGSKLELFHRALRTQVDAHVLPWVATLAGSSRGVLVEAVRAGHADLGLVLVAAVERAATDPVAASEADRVFDALEQALAPGRGRPGPTAGALAATVIGLHLRLRAGLGDAAVTRAAAALRDRLAPITERTPA